MIAGLKGSSLVVVAVNAALVAVVDIIINWRTLQRARIESRRKIWGDDPDLSVGYRVIVFDGYLSIGTMALVIEGITYAAAAWLATKL